MASEENQIRKFRKKLRQIEHLESVRRELTDDELRKVATKGSIRAQLQILLSQILQESEPHRVPHISRPRFKLSASPREQSLEDNSSSVECENIHLESNDNHQSQQSSRNSSNAGMGKRKLIESDLEKLQNENNENRTNGKQIKAETVVQEIATENVPSASTSETQSTKDVRKQYRAFVHAKIAATELKGHDDMVLALAIDKNIIVSGSRDTTGRVWDLETGEELCSLRGHTGSVNGVALLSPDLSQELAKKLNYETNRIVLTASTDCSIRLWSIPSGKQLKSIYTFNSITCLGILEDLFFAVCGTDGGKVEVWNAVSNGVVHSSKAHNECVTCLEVSGSQFCSGSADGMVIIWALLSKEVQVLYTLEPGANDEIPRLRSLKSIASHYGRIFLGDNGSTIKVLSWRRERMHAVSNHDRNYGCTDALTTFEDLLLSSSYNLDSGLASINIRLLPEMEYLCSIHEEAHKILTLSSSRRGDGQFFIVSGGTELLIWDLIDKPQKKNFERYNTADVVDMCHIESLDYEPEKIESEESSISETTDDDQESTNVIPDQNELHQSAQGIRNSWTSWCSLV